MDTGVGLDVGFGVGAGVFLIGVVSCEGITVPVDPAGVPVVFSVLPEGVCVAGAPVAAVVGVTSSNGSGLFGFAEVVAVGDP